MVVLTDNYCINDIDKISEAPVDIKTVANPYLEATSSVGRNAPETRALEHRAGSISLAKRALSDSMSSPILND